LFGRRNKYVTAFLKFLIFVRTGPKLYFLPMRKIILNLAVSLDGLIEGPKGEFDWCFTDQDYGMNQFLQGIDTIFFGRKSYEMMLAYDANPYPNKMKYVFSRNLQPAAAQTEVISDNTLEAAAAIRRQSGKDIWLFGGADLTTSFLNAGLVDELQLSVHPVVLGQGKPLFAGIRERKHFRLTDTKTYDTGLVQLFYESILSSPVNQL
jgi:dihydrofolate reductase